MSYTTPSHHISHAQAWIDMFLLIPYFCTPVMVLWFFSFLPEEWWRGSRGIGTMIVFSCQWLFVWYVCFLLHATREKKHQGWPQASSTVELALHTWIIWPDAVTQHTTACCTAQLVDITFMKNCSTNITSLIVVRFQGNDVSKICASLSIFKPYIYHENDDISLYTCHYSLMCNLYCRTPC